MNNLIQYLFGQSEMSTASSMSEMEYYENVVDSFETPELSNDPQQTQPTLFNVMSSFQVNCKLNLRHISQQAKNCVYNPKKFSAVIMTIANPSATALVFKSGVIRVMGTKTVADSKIASKKFAKIIKKLGYEVHYSHFKVTNLMAKCNVQFTISMMKLNDYLDGSLYEPESYAGLVYRMVEPKITIIVFRTGKVVFCGTQDEQSINEAYHKIYNVLLAHKKVPIM